jgi:hypothetical protein
MPKILFVLMSLALFAGCGPDRRVMQVDIEGTKTFPRELVGTWKTQDGQWEIEFLPDGYIKEAKIPLGGQRLQPGKILRFDIPKYEGKAEYEPGIWKVFYESEQRELTVVLELKHFYHDVGHHAVEGNNTDILSGSFSEDMSEWTPDLQTFGKVDALIFEGWTLIERKEFVHFEEPQYRGTLVFKKSW